MISIMLFSLSHPLIHREKPRSVVLSRLRRSSDCCQSRVTRARIISPMSADSMSSTFGLIPIHEPRSTFPHIHIILVHGIGGHWETTWTVKIGDKKFFWAEWLQNDDLLRTARISTFGYDAGKRFWIPRRQSIAGPEDFALELLMCLAKRNENVSVKFLAREKQ